MELKIKEKLLVCAKNEQLFEAALQKHANETPEDARFELLAFCYFQFSDLYPEILLNVLYDNNLIAKRIRQTNSTFKMFDLSDKGKQPK